MATAGSYSLLKEFSWQCLVSLMQVQDAGGQDLAKLERETKRWSQRNHEGKAKRGFFFPTTMNLVLNMHIMEYGSIPYMYMYVGMAWEKMAPHQNDTFRTLL